MKFFIFGDGKWSKNHQRILKDIGVELSVFDIDSTPHDALAACGTPSAVIITASTVNHFPLTVFFLKRGIPVFCEKPICLEKWQLSVLNSFDIPAAPIFMAGHQLTFDPTVSMIAAEGNATFFSSKRSGAIPRSEGAVMSLAVHDIAIAMHLFQYQNPIEITVSGNQHSAQVNILWPSGKMADIFVQSVAQVQLRHAAIVQDTGKVTYLDPGCWNRTNLLKEELSYFTECILYSIKPLKNGLADAIAVTNITISCRDKLERQLSQKGN